MSADRLFVDGEYIAASPEWVHWVGTVIPSELRAGDRLNGLDVLSVDERGIVVALPMRDPFEPADGEV